MVMSQINANWFKFAVGALTIFAVVGNAWLRKPRPRDEGGDGQMSTPIIEITQPAQMVFWRSCAERRQP